MSPSRWLAETFSLQRDRWILWLPVGLVAGAAAWLVWPVDPPWWLGAGVFCVAAVAAWGVSAWPSRRSRGLWMAVRRLFAGLLALAAAAALGATAAQLRAGALAAPAFAESESPRRVEGWVVANDAGDAGARLRLLVRSIDGLARPPRYVRVSVGDAGVLAPGRAATCTAVLGPPSGPLAPGGYDFARRAYFERLAATGFAFGRCRAANFGQPASWLDRARLRLAALRADLAAAIVEASPGRGGAIGAALVTGDRSSVDAGTNEALRDSGLGHLLSVSGIHMGVVGGFIFGLVLRLLSLIPPIALRWPVKKLAAVAALVSLGAYLLISGASVPALRSFVMACVAFGAILIDRPAISMRGLALAALIVVLLFPESVLEPGFQMSFAATMALIALFETMRRSAHEPALPTPGPLIGALQSVTRGIGAVLMISLVAGLATDPFAIYHFQRFALYALPANLITAPIMSFLVAPLAVLAAALAPFGMAEPALALMSGALELIAEVGEVFGDRPEAVQAAPRPPDAAFLLWVGGIVWACIWRGALRWAGLAPIAVGVVLAATAQQPIVAFDGDLRVIFIRQADGGEGEWSLIRAPGRSTYARDRVGAMLGLTPQELDVMAPPTTCVESGCFWRAPGGRDFAFISSDEGWERGCSAGGVVVAAIRAEPGYATRCRLAALVDADDLSRQGGAFFYETEAGMRIARAIDPAARRPWRWRPGSSGEAQE